MTDFLGTSLAFPIRPDGRGGLTLAVGVEAVEDSIRAIIESQKGSHTFEPWLGWPIDVFAHASDLYVIAQKIKDAILDAEDRVDPDSLQVEVVISDSGELRTAISYSIAGEFTLRTLQLGFRELK